MCEPLCKKFYCFSELAVLRQIAVIQLTLIYIILQFTVFTIYSNNYHQALFFSFFFLFTPRRLFCIPTIPTFFAFHRFFLYSYTSHTSNRPCRTKISRSPITMATHPPVLSSTLAPWVSQPSHSPPVRLPLPCPPVRCRSAADAGC